VKSQPGTAEPYRARSRAASLLVTLGLGLDFTVARGILGSLEPIGS
jgi:hypothetical protein